MSDRPSESLLDQGRPKGETAKPVTAEVSLADLLKAFQELPDELKVQLQVRVIEDGHNLELMLRVPELWAKALRKALPHRSSSS